MWPPMLSLAQVQHLQPVDEGEYNPVSNLLCHYDYCVLLFMLYEISVLSPVCLLLTEVLPTSTSVPFLYRELLCLMSLLMIITDIEQHLVADGCYGQSLTYILLHTVCAT